MPKHPHTNNSSSDSTTPTPPSTLKEFLRQAARPFGFLLLFIMVCAFLAQYLTGTETLQEYADNNPEIAYGTSSETADSDANTTEHSDEDMAEEEPKSTVTENTVTENMMTEDPVARETSDNPPAYDIPETSVSDAADSPEPDSAISNMENNDMTSISERTTYQDGFYYEPINDTIKARITGISYPEADCSISYDDLNYVGLLYVDFNGNIQEGELICNKAIAQDMVEIFYELYQNDYRIEQIRLIDEYGGDDTLSMLDNNTSCFNYRVVDGTTTLSKHALGCAIDINPFYNPYVVFNKNGDGETYISPKGSEIYADRSQDFPYKIDENDLCYKLFTSHGFTWGGNWNSSKDYQHFQIVLPD